MLKTKINQGVMHYNVLEKEFSIIGIQKPISRNFFNKYKKTEIFRFGDFVAYVIEKDF